jgi:hypothetical protein
MPQDYNVILVDDDERNARPVMAPRRPTYGGRVPARPVYYQAAPQPAVIYQPAPALRPAGLAGMTTAELVEVGAQVLAAIQPLPAAPTAIGEVETDVENLVIYQTALATHAKRDEQLRTLGGLLARLLRK